MKNWIRFRSRQGVTLLQTRPKVVVLPSRLALVDGTAAHMPPPKKRKVLVDEFIVRLKDKQKLLLNDSRLLEVSNLKFVRQNGSQMRYIYDIIGGILGCDVTLSRMPDGRDSDDEDTRCAEGLD